MWEKFRPNRKYKDRLFRFLFRDKKDLLQLYNAVNSSNYINPNDLEIITLEDVIFMKMKNDLSFMIGNRLNLYEHQSTYSPNMPIRGLIYFSRQYEGIIAEVNDNLSKNMSLKRAIKNAMDSCIEKEILTDILVKNRAEVMHMLLTEYDEEKHMRDTYKEGYEEGERVGEQIGYSKGEAAGYEEGERVGEQNGYNKLLDAQIEKKLSRGKNIPEIAEELEVDVSTVEDRIKSLKR